MMSVVDPSSITAEWVRTTVAARVACVNQRNLHTPGQAKLAVRDYQLDAWLALLRAYFADGVQRQMLVLPTGCGKTVTFSMLAYLIQCLQGECRTIVLAHRDVLVQQALGTFRWVWPEASQGRICAEETIYGRDVTGAMVPTLGRRDKTHAKGHNPKLLRVMARGPYHLVIVDESHHSAADTYRRVLEALHTPHTVRLGVTATPNRTDGLALSDVYDQITFSYPLVQAIEERHLVPPRGVRVHLDIGLDDVKTSKAKGGDFDDAALGAKFNPPSVRARCVAAWKQYAPGKKTILFACTVEHARNLAADFRAAGVAAAAITGETDDAERRALFRRLREGDLAMLISVMVLTEGFDDPSVECVYLVRPTQSWSLYVQMVGRGLRLNGPAKTECLILDVTGNTTKYSLRGLSMLGGFQVDEVEESTKPRQLGIDDDLGLASKPDKPEQSDLFVQVSGATEVDLVSVRRSGLYQWQATQFGHALMLGGPDLGGIFLVRQHDPDRDKLAKSCADLFKIVHMQRRSEIPSDVDPEGGYMAHEIGSKLTFDEAMALAEQEAPRLGAKRSRAGVDDSGIRAASDEEVLVAVVDLARRNRQLNARLPNKMQTAAQKASDAQRQCLARELGLTTAQLDHPRLTRGEAQRLIIWGKAAGFQRVRLPDWLREAKSAEQSEAMAG